MKRLFTSLSLLIMYNVLCAQTTVVQNIQVKTAQGTAPNTTMPTNGGVAYYDANGIIKKADLKFLLGKKVDSAIKVNDSTLRFVSQYGNTYDVVIRGLMDAVSKVFLDSLRLGLKKDTTITRNNGSGTTQLASTSPTADTLIIATLRDSSDVKFRTNVDGSVSAYLTASGVSANTYGDPTHVPQIQVDANGRIKSVTLISITGGTGGATDLSPTVGTTTVIINSSTGTDATIPAAIANVSAGLTTAAKQARYDSLVQVANSGHGKPILRAPTSLDSLVARGVGMTGTGRMNVVYTGNNDSISYNISLNNLGHGIFTPTTGQTITLVAVNRNIVNPAGTIAALTIVLPTSPANGDEVSMKFTQAVTTITWSGGTVVGGSTGAAAGILLTLIYDATAGSWY